MSSCNGPTIGKGGGLVSLVLLSVAGALPAAAQETSSAAPTPQDSSRTGDATEPPGQLPITLTATPENGLEIAFQAQGGIYFNPHPTQGRNFGQLFSDKANSPQLNQAMLTISNPAKAIDDGYAVGFNLQALYGSDGRIASIAGITGRWIDARNQLAVTQANVAAHLPWLSAGGVDVKAGILTGAMGLESFDPGARPFYTFSYLSNYLLPFEHVGVIATVNINAHLSVFGQIDGGNSVAIGRGDPNGRPAGYLGMALNGIADGKLTVLATTRIGPELARAAFPDAARRLRYWNDLSILYDPNDRLSVRLEANYHHDEGLRASGYALMGFATYKVTPSIAISGRAEVYRDETGQFTVALLDNQGYIDSLQGRPTRILTAPPTTYSSLTVGLTIKPANLPKGVSVMIRPEVRYDRSLNGTRPFNDFKDRDALMFGGDLIIGL